MLTGKYAPDAPPAADTRPGRGDRRIQQTEWRPESLRIAQAIAQHVARRGTTSVAFALAWVLKNRRVGATMAGPRTEAQWDGYPDALQLQPGPDDEKLVDSLVPPGHASTHGYTDPGYPVEGGRCDFAPAVRARGGWRPHGRFGGRSRDRTGATAQMTRYFRPQPAQ